MGHRWFAKENGASVMRTRQDFERFIAIALTASSLLVGCSTAERTIGINPDAHESDMGRPSSLASCKDEFEMEVYEKIHIHEWNEVNGREASKKDLDNERVEIKRVFDWSKTIKDKDIRSCYESWLWYLDYQLDDAYRVLAAQEKRAAWLRTHSIPTPPNGSSHDPAH
jgi:hypothetical protein